MKRKRERSKLANYRDVDQTSDAIVEATPTSPLTVSKQKNTSDDTNSGPLLSPSSLLRGSPCTTTWVTIPSAVITKCCV
ncbi:BnaA09g42510D [Brassica napus]|uniref:(rape) hypothetical protein n=1 Tax=Brassica napus TaxID=3708 RepID=A0A078FLE4_BRANA|nr:unnamed protein product [Brassica napus]CDY13749.1 BnaA09g42510D [Brassica napus]